MTQQLEPGIFKVYIHIRKVLIIQMWTILAP